VLEIGAGSGYAAAVLSRIVRAGYSVERHAELAALALYRLRSLGYDNVVVRIGDGSGGWPEVGPFDAILAAAGAPVVPDALRRQLAVGGRLVLPVGESRDRQRLVKLTRVAADRWTEEALGDVRFVPLVGEHGWRDDAPVRDARPAPRQARKPQPRGDIPSLLATAMDPLPAIDDPAFGRLYDRFAGARVVLLGEASHGTSEFYRARAAITRRLIEEHGFRIVAVEADWPDAATVDRHVRGLPPREHAPAPFQRFPTWMWRNLEVASFIAWLRDWNLGRPGADRASFNGLDLYSLNSSIHAVLAYLDRVDPEAAAVARRRYGCLEPWASDPARYGHVALTRGFALCEQGVVDTLRDLLESRLEYSRDDGARFFDAAQNARLVRNAEAYYRAMYYGSADSWNLRDSHMFDTLQHLLAARGEDAKAVVWAHNSHIGDARETDMGRERGELNIGQLCRQAWGADAALLGFGTHAGTVAAADDWDAPMRVMDVNPSRPDSVERLFHDSDVPRALLDLRAGAGDDDAREALAPDRLERYIGVVYRPATERWSHYAASSLGRQFDGWTWFDTTSAVTPLGDGHAPGVPDTWPSGL
jgi:erythromycin esterase-like protein